MRACGWSGNGAAFLMMSSRSPAGIPAARPGCSRVERRWSKRRDHGPHIGSDNVVQQHHALDLGQAGPTPRRLVNRQTAAVFNEQNHVLVGLPPETASFFIVLRAVDDA